jgi:hypothetical protein
MSKRTTRHGLTIQIALYAFALGVAGIQQSSALPINQGNKQERAACRQDVRRFCQTELHNNPDDMLSITSCLQTNRTKISRACRNAWRATVNKKPPGTSYPDCACRATTALASLTARPSSPFRSRLSLATFAQSSFSSDVVALWVCLSASFAVQGILGAPVLQSCSGRKRVVSVLGSKALRAVELPEAQNYPWCAEYG